MSFNSLPPELQHIIILNCLQISPPRSASTSNARYLPTIKVNEATVLARVSPSCRVIVSTLIYRHIRATTPSSLQQLHTTLTQRPDLAELVRSIHLGPDQELPNKGLPHGHWEGDLKTSLFDRDLLPRWYLPAASFAASCNRTCQRIAVQLAVESAGKEIGVWPWGGGSRRDKGKTGLRAWVARIVQVQAALDLFLLEMRRIEDTRGPTDHVGGGTEETVHRHWEDSPVWPPCRRYPTLRIWLNGRRRPPSSLANGAPFEGHDGTFFITEDELWQHLTKPGGSADHFDHLLLLTRSTAQSLNLTGRNEWRRVRFDLGGPDTFHNLVHLNNLPAEGEVQSEPEDHLPRWIDEASVYEEDADSSAREPPLVGAEELIDLGRSVLSMTTNVVNLSLTGFLFRTLPALKNPESLRSLVIGPRCRYWNDTLPSEGALRFSKLERLRIVGKMSKDDANRITLELPALRQLEWELPQEKVSVQNVYANIYRLQGQSNPASFDAGRAQGMAARTPRASQAEDALRSLSITARSSTITSTSETAQVAPTSSSPPDSAPSPPAPTPRSTYILLHPSIVRTLLHTNTIVNVAQEVRQAWQEGRPVAGTLHPVKVVASGSRSGHDGPPGAGAGAGQTARSGRDVNELYGEGRRWWEEGKGYATRGE